MNIYLIKYTNGNDYDKFDSFVVIAENEKQALETYPREIWDMDLEVYVPMKTSEISVRDLWSWTDNTEELEITLIGTAKPDSKHSIVCASFNAG